MSLTSKISGQFPDKDFQEILRNIIPKRNEFYTISGKEAFSKSYVMKVPNELENIYESGMVGTAFDYLARFIVAQKINKNKEGAYTKIVAETALSWIGLEIDEDEFFNEFDKRYRESIKVVEEYVKGDNIEINESLIESACYLARLDSVVRSRLFINDLKAFPFGRESKDIINELKMLTQLFIDTFIKSNLVKKNSDVVFNPHFGICTKKCGGADADIFIDSVLYDFKTNKKRGYKWQEIAQLIGYYLFNEIATKTDSKGVSLRGYTIDKIAIYKARYGEIECFDLDNINKTKKSIAINLLVDNLEIENFTKIEVSKEDVEKMEKEEREIIESRNDKGIKKNPNERVCKNCYKTLDIQNFDFIEYSKGIRYKHICKKCVEDLQQKKVREKEQQKLRIIEQRKLKIIQFSGIKNVCTICKIEKPIEEFERRGKDSTGNSIYRNQCKICRKNMKK